MTVAKGTFYGLGIAPRLLETLEKNKFVTPTPIQQQAIPVALLGTDIVGIAQTGTGKTLAFAIPTIQRLARLKGQALIILPTRELAMQVEETFEKMGRDFGLRCAILIGGKSINPQIDQLRKGPHVIVGTPGRIIDHLEQRTLRMDEVHTLILDEADRMFDMGFQPQIEKILQKVPTERQTMLFSATMPPAISKLAAKHLKGPIRIEVAPPGKTIDAIAQEVYLVSREQKLDLLVRLLHDNQGTILVFSRTRHSAERLCRMLKGMGQNAAEIHADRSMAQRKEALEGFKRGKYRILIATDIASRGIDVTGIELVVNYDIPENPEDYVHRIGRTGRAGRSGKAITFASPDQKAKLAEIEKLTRLMLKPITPPNLPPPPGIVASHTKHANIAYGGQRRSKRRPR
jgi:ATP-dependent RNA helicase RhlE